MLRVDHRSAETFRAGEVRGVSVVVPVVPGGGDQPSRGSGPALSGSRVFDFRRPDLVHAAPAGSDNLLAVTDVAVNTGLVGSVGDVTKDRIPVGYRLLLEPGPKRISERMQVRIRAKARIAEQAPGAAELLTGLEDLEGLPGNRRLTLLAIPIPESPAPTIRKSTSGTAVTGFGSGGGESRPGGKPAPGNSASG